MSSFIPVRQARVASITEVAGGGSVLVGTSSYSLRRPQTKWRRRPWATRLIWNTRRQIWELSVNCGFVNGEDPVAVGYRPGDWQSPPSAVNLIDKPRIPVFEWRDVDGSAEPIPAYFRLRGVRKERSLIIENEGVTVDGTPEDPSLPPRRYLKSADVWVEVSRPSLSLNVTVEGNLVTGQLVDYEVRLDASRLEKDGGRARLVVGSRMPEPVRPTFQDRLAGLYQDDGVDRRIIASLFLFSPPNGAERPLAEWRSYVQHRTGWNLHHAAKNDPPRNTPQSIGPVVTLVSRYTIVPQATMGALEAEQQRIFAAVLNDNTNEGRFWHI